MRIPLPSVLTPALILSPPLINVKALPAKTVGGVKTPIAVVKP